ncbi:MAG: hypothetical protein ACJAYG_001618 [Oceanicoccus sp.]|jgi:hypothetical protein
MINERRNFYRIEDTVLLRYQVIDESTALANIVPLHFEEDANYSLMRELQSIDQDNNKHLRPIAELNYELEAYLKGISKKIDLIAVRLAASEEQAPDFKRLNISLSEGGLSFLSAQPLANDSHLAVQLTLLPSRQTVVMFVRVINCTKIEDGHNISCCTVNLQDNHNHIVAKHIIQLQLAQRRQHYE